MKTADDPYLRRTQIALLFLALIAVVGLAPIDEDASILAWTAQAEPITCVSQTRFPGQDACPPEAQPNASVAALRIAAIFAP